MRNNESKKKYWKWLVWDAIALFGLRMLQVKLLFICIN